MTELHARNTNVVTADGGTFSISEGIPSASVGSKVAPLSSSSPQHCFRYRVVKRVLDVALVLLASPILLPLIAVVAAAVRLTSTGPVFFSHRRIRRHGAFFTMWKFRTMCINSSEVLNSHLSEDAAAQAEWRRTHKLKRDPRITRVGRFLRKTSLDELPQLWNVLNGSMSLVGPRPIVAAEVEKYGEFFADYCLVKPGITGLWQVSGRSACTYEERVQLDRSYARNWSLRGDLAILAKTLTAVVNQDGAY